MIERITVIGAGSTGHAVAAILSKRGFQVTFHDDERWADRFRNIEERGGITLRGGMYGMGMPAKLTTDPAEAVRGAQAIFVHVWSERQEEIARRIAPYLEDGQHILLIPGNLGSFVFRRVFQEMGVAANVTLTEKEGNFCPCRLSGKAEVTTGKIREERCAVMEAMGMKEHGNPMLTISKVQSLEEHPEIWDFYNYMDGPNALDHRYLHEDCGCGGAFALSAAERLGLDMPVLRAFLGVAGAINDRDDIRDGRTLENLGFPKDLTLEEIYRLI